MCEFTMHVTDYLLSLTSGAEDPVMYVMFCPPLQRVDCIYCLFNLSCLFGISEKYYQQL